MGGQLQIDPTRIQQHGKDLKDNVSKQLEKAGEALNADNVYNLEGGSFSITCTTASMAYPGAIQFAFEDLKTHLEMLEGFASGIETTAKNYKGSNDASIIKKA